MCIHRRRRLPFRVLFPLERAHEDQFGQPFRHRNTQRAVRFADPFMQRFQLLAEQIAHQHDHHADGHHDPRHLAQHPQRRADRADQHDDHAARFRHDRDDGMRRQIGIGNQTVHPFLGMHRRDRCIVPIQQRRKQPLFELVLHGARRVFLEPAHECAQQQLCNNDQHKQQRMQHKAVQIMIHRTVDHLAQHPRQHNARHAVDHVCKQQQSDLPSESGCCIPQPSDRFLFDFGSLFLHVNPAMRTLMHSHLCSSFHTRSAPLADPCCNTDDRTRLSRSAG